MLYTCNLSYRFHIKPITKKLDGAEITTWKYDDDQEYFNFEIHFPLEEVKEDFHWESGSFFLADFKDYISDIGSVLLKDGFLIIGGRKEKGN